MSHEKLYTVFKKQFPHCSKWVEEWFPNGKDSIRIRVTDGSDLVFTYHNGINWRFETVDSFINGLKKGGQSMNVRLHDNLHEEH